MSTLETRETARASSRTRPATTRRPATAPGPVTRRRRATALVWAADDQRADEAVEHLLRGLWPHWFDFEIAEVRHLPRHLPCPLPADAPDNLASTTRERWAWALIPAPKAEAAHR